MFVSRRNQKLTAVMLREKLYVNFTVVTLRYYLNTVRDVFLTLTKSFCCLNLNNG